MSTDIRYCMLDERCILRYCLHAGPISLAETVPGYDAEIDAETSAHVPHGTVDAFLKALCENYGAYGIAAVDGDMVVGQVRFYPRALARMWTTDVGHDLNACIQELDQVRAMGHTRLDTMTQQSSLSPCALNLGCFQVVNDYQAMAEGRPTEQPSYLRQGIGTMLLQKAIEWAQANDWEEIHAPAIPHIRPLMAWSCHLSVEHYRKCGFEIRPALATSDAPVSQRRGYHGEAMKRMWEPYSHMSDEEVSKGYHAILKIN